MNIAEMVFFWGAVAMYAAAFALSAFIFAFQRPAKPRLVAAFLWIGFASHATAAIIRWAALEHAPVTDRYELNLVGSWLVMLVYLAARRFHKVYPQVGLAVMPITFLLMGHGVIHRVSVTEMGAAYDSPWLAIHVAFAFLAFGCFVIAAGAAVLLLSKERWPKGASMRKLPEPEKLDLMSHRFIVLGFLCHAIMLVAGAIWAKNLWGHYWSWDALETWSLVTFLFYAFYLHARAFLGLKGKRAAWLASAGLIIVWISFWGVEWFAPSPGHPGP